jgi:hypothetical protein
MKVKKDRAKKMGWMNPPTVFVAFRRVSAALIAACSFSAKEGLYYASTMPASRMTCFLALPCENPPLILMTR